MIELPLKGLIYAVNRIGITSYKISTRWWKKM